MSVTFTSAVTRELRTWRCAACGFETEAEVVGVGEGAQSFLNSGGTADRRAEADAVAELDRVMGLAACPKCGQRDPAAVRSWWMRQVLPLVISAAFVAFLGWAPLLFGLNMKPSDQWLAGWIMTGIGLLVCGFMLLPAWMKWETAKQGVRFPPTD